MARIVGLALTILFFGYGLVRIGVGTALFAQSMDVIAFPQLAEAVSDVRLFIDEREDKQLVTFSVPGYFLYIVGMGAALVTGSVGAFVRKRFGLISLGLYLVMHAALFVNFQEVNYKLIGFLITVIMVIALGVLRPPAAGRDLIGTARQSA